MAFPLGGKITEVRIFHWRPFFRKVAQSVERAQLLDAASVVRFHSFLLILMVKLIPDAVVIRYHTYSPYSNEVIMKIICHNLIDIKTGKPVAVHLAGDFDRKKLKSQRNQIAKDARVSARRFQKGFSAV